MSAPYRMGDQLVGDMVSLDPGRVSTLRLVRDLELPEGAVAGDFVRCAVFDRLHDYQEWTQLKKIEVVFFDPERTDEAVDLSIQTELVARSARKPWVVQNLARRCPTATSLKEAMVVLTATANAVAVRMTRKDELEVIAPYGVEDLLRGLVRATEPSRIGQLRQVYAEEKWKTRYPYISFEEQ